MTAAALDTREFNELCSIILSTVGIQLGEAKRTLLEGRLAPILRRRSLGRYRDYLAFVKSDEQGLVEMVNAITTNKTSFFREPHHFTMLRDVLRARTPGEPPFHIWSAGCSSGEEPYTIAMTAQDAGVPVRITASDVDTNMIAKASRGIYPDDQRDELAPDVLHRFFQRGRGDQAGYLRVRPELQRDIEFMHVNLIEPAWPFTTRFDAIFCRNVIIYFDRKTQDSLFRRYARLLVPGGLLFLGHSESVGWLTDLFEPIGTTVYRVVGGLPRPTIVPKAIVPRTPTVGLAVPIFRIDAGDVRASKQPCELRTVLGSCIAACLYDPVARIGGMNHFMLPDGGQTDQPTRYGVHAMELLINDIMKLGGDRSRLRAKIFGAANVIHMERSSVDVGRDNTLFIRRFLTAERIPIEAEKLGGTRPLEVRMDPITGRVRVRALGADTLGDLIEAERNSQARRWRPSDPPPDLSDVLF